jgi:two-component system sensor histidine kinase YesM
MYKGNMSPLTKKLNSANLYLILILNITLPLIVLMLNNLIIQFQLSRKLLLSPTAGYYVRLNFLSLILAAVTLFIIDYIYILSPFHHLEDVLKEYANLTTMDLKKPFDKRFVKSSLEQNFLDMLQIQKNMDKQTRKTESRIQSTELYALQTQINPHFLYNTLDSIRGLALIHGVEEIATMTESLSCLFRSMIANEGQMLLLRSEIENVHNYITIQNFRFRNRFDYEYQISTTLMDQYLIPNMTLQPIVENAIMHGLEGKYGKGKIRLSGYVTEKRLILTITDNGIGIEDEKLKYLNQRLLDYNVPVPKEHIPHHTGIALLNINKQIKLKFGKQYGISLASTPNVYTSTELILPAILADQTAKQEKLYD